MNNFLLFANVACIFVNLYTTFLFLKVGLYFVAVVPLLLIALNYNAVRKLVS